MIFKTLKEILEHLSTLGQDGLEARSEPEIKVTARVWREKTQTWETI